MLNVQQQEEREKKKWFSVEGIDKKKLDKIYVMPIEIVKHLTFFVCITINGHVHVNE